MIKPEDFNSKLLEIQNEYKDTYEMFDYLNGSRDLYIDENSKLKQDIKRLRRLSLYFFICFVIEFILFLVAVNI